MSKQKQFIENLTLTKEGSENFFHNALCSGLSEIRLYGLELTFKKADYVEARKTLQAKIAKGNVPHTLNWYESDKKEGIKPEACYEDVLMEILANGKKLSLKDHENGFGTKSIGLKEVYERVAKTPINHLIEYINDTGGDAVTADVVLQTVFYKDVIFG